MPLATGERRQFHSTASAVRPSQVGRQRGISRTKALRTHLLALPKDPWALNHPASTLDETPYDLCRPSLSSGAPVSKSREMTGQWWTKRRKARSDGRGVAARILSRSVCESATPAFAQPELGSHMRHDRSSSSTSGKVRIAWGLSCPFGLSHGRPLDLCDRPGAAIPPSVALLATALA